MRAEKWQTMLAGAAIGFLTALGSVGCLTSGMGLAGADMVLVAAVCGLSATIFAVCSRIRLGLVPLCVLAVLTGYLWQRGDLSDSVESLIYQISCLYDKGYGWGVIGGILEENVTLALSVLGCVISAVIAWSVARGHGAWLGIVTALIPLAFCVVLTDTVPKESDLFILFFGVVLLLLTQTVRRRNPRQGNALTAMLTLPVALALGLLFLLVPQSGYERQDGADRLQQLIQEWFDISPDDSRLPSRPPYLGMEGNGDTRYVNLAAVGPRKELSTAVMQITAEETTTLYLRGNACDVYTGTSWVATEGLWPRDSEYRMWNFWEAKKATLRFRNAHSVRYFCYSPKGLFMTDGRVKNSGNAKSYVITYYNRPSGYSLENAEPLTAADRQELQPYLQLPTDTAQRARQILRRVVSGNTSDAWLYACDIAEYVKNSAEYDLHTERMPGNATDFAIWFLENSDTGYCTHFASATTVLLRAAGIPARYVTGYVVDTQAGEEVIARQRDSHAWVECYINGHGWVPLEATPAGFRPSVSPGTEPDDTQPPTDLTPTGPVQTEPSQETTLPEDHTPGSTEGPAIEQPRERRGWVGIVLLCLAAVMTVLGQWRLRVWLRWRRQHRGSANARALALWQEVACLSRLLKQTPDQALYEFALKARFSQYSLTAVELRQFDHWLSHAKKRLKSRPIWQQLVYTLILAIY
ncbi:MAG: transglutaminase domain-containing protein [Oscillospiraceae bacterium]|nr:transglutaminase domain-containing protein [Oscillospiraceae bacterium]